MLRTGTDSLEGVRSLCPNLTADSILHGERPSPTARDNRDSVDARS